MKWLRAITKGKATCLDNIKIEILNTLKGCGLDKITYFK